MPFIHSLENCESQFQDHMLQISIFFYHTASQCGNSEEASIVHVNYVCCSLLLAGTVHLDPSGLGGIQSVWRNRSELV